MTNRRLPSHEVEPLSHQKIGPDDIERIVGTRGQTSWPCGSLRVELCGLQTEFLGNVGRQSNRKPKLDPVVRRIHQILLRAQVPLSSLDARVPQQ